MKNIDFISQNQIFENELLYKNQWAYDESMVFYKQGGSGNNWALGY